jgi:hypothetical protein
LKQERKRSSSRKPATAGAETTPAPTANVAKGASDDRQARNQAVIRLLREWMADDSGYDQKVWPSLKEAIERYRLSYRKRFGDQAG